MEQFQKNFQEEVHRLRTMWSLAAAAAAVGAVVVMFLLLLLLIHFFYDIDSGPLLVPSCIAVLLLITIFGFFYLKSNDLEFNDTDSIATIHHHPAFYKAVAAIFLLPSFLWVTSFKAMSKYWKLNRINQERCMDMLEKLATDGRMSLEELQEISPDHWHLIILDLKLFDGFMLLERPPRVAISESLREKLLKTVESD